MRHRFFGVFASKCLPVGHAPRELLDHFGYNPVVEVDFDRPAAQLDDILNHIGDYQEFVDSNYERLLEVGTWDERAKAIVQHVEQDLSKREPAVIWRLATVIVGASRR